MGYNRYLLLLLFIVTDLRMSSFGLTKKLNFTVFTVHSKYFIDPFTGTNTQTIESS